jgi:hypothetical protein
MLLLAMPQHGIAPWACYVCQEEQPAGSRQYPFPRHTLDLAQMVCKDCWAIALRLAYAPN